MSKVDLYDALRRASQHDPDALHTLVDAYHSRVFGLLYRLTGLREVAEDLLQETFLRLVRTIGRFSPAREDGDGLKQFEAWLFRIAANLARDHARRMRRRGPVGSLEATVDNGEPAAFDSAASPQPPPDERLMNLEAGERLTTSLAKLTDAEREIILLRHFSDLSFREIAAMLDVPLGTALARAHRALGRLRAEMGLGT